MIQTPVQRTVDWFRQAAALAEAGDAELLDAFVTRRCESAFAELVRRHGAMVWGVCRRMLANQQDAEDCYQATFLVLVRKASAVRPRAQVGAWLHGVAYHTALKARSVGGRRGHMEKQMERLPEPTPTAVNDEEWTRLLDAELQALPERYRVPIVLCELEGRTIKSVAQELGCPVGTIAGRLSRGRDLLAKRLAKHGVPFAASALTAVLASQASAAPPTLALASPSAAAIHLASAAIHAMFVARLKSALAVVAILVFALGLGGLAYHAFADSPDPNPIVHIDPGENKAEQAKDDTAWGDAVDGVQFGVAFKNGRSSYRVGDTATLVLKARNVADVAKSFEDEYATLYHDSGLPQVIDSAGKAVKVTPRTSVRRPMAADRTIKLAAKQVVVLGEIPYTIGPETQNVPWIDAGPGKYRIRFDKRRSDVLRPTGTLEMTVVEPTAWGKAVDGVEYGFEFKGGRTSYTLGEKVTFVLKARNVSDKAVKFEQVEIIGTSSVARPAIGPGATGAALPTVLDAAGKKVEAWPTYTKGAIWQAKVREFSLEPREIATLGEITFTLGPSRGVPGIAADAGVYQVRYDTVCWLAGHQRPTGTLEMTVVDPTAWGKAVDGVEYGFAFKGNRRDYLIGDDVTIQFKARNASKKDVEIQQVGIRGVVTQIGGGIGCVLPKVIDAKGKPVKVQGVNVAGFPLQGSIRDVKIRAGETVELGEVVYSLGAGVNVPRIDAAPGVFAVSFDTICWLPGHKRPTGTMEMRVSEKPKLLDLFAAIQPGMTRDEVEAIVGKAVTPPNAQPGGELHAYYLGSQYMERKPLPQESPFMPAGIRVIYVDGRVTQKLHNPQWVAAPP